MDNPEDRSTLIERQDFRGSFVAISGFVALLCWWIGISGFMTVGGFASGGAGFLSFLLVPLLATVAAYIVARRYMRFTRGVGAGRHNSRN
ncbi:hypothetical protein ACVWY0_001166 [Arthrobacter sp. UYNi723]